MSSYIAKQKTTKESLAVLSEGREIWKIYNTTKFGRTIREEFRLEAPDPGWYQIRRALEANATNKSVDFTAFKSAYARLTKKLIPQVYDFGFLIK